MASYVIHYTTGKKLLEKLNISKEEQAGFLLGNLIADSLKTIGNETNPEIIRKLKKQYREQIQNEKTATHFRCKEDFDKNIQLCNLKKFLETYSKFMDNPTVLGYFFHLFTDNHFFKNVFDDAFVCLDNNGKVTDKWKDTTQYKVLKDGKIVTPKEFWTEENIYGDYTKMNKLVLTNYKINFDVDLLRKGLKLYPNPGIKEVNFENIESVIRETNSYIKDSETADISNLKIFDSNKILEFIDEVGNKFIDQNNEYIKKYKR